MVRSTLERLCREQQDAVPIQISIIPNSMPTVCEVTYITVRFLQGPRNCWERIDIFFKLDRQPGAPTTDVVAGSSAADGFGSGLASLLQIEKE